MKIFYLGLSALLLLLTTSGCPTFQPTVASAPAAQKPVLDPPATGDPTGSPVPAGAPFFQSIIEKFHVPWPTTIEVAVDGIILKEEPQGCGNSGCYIVLSNKENPSGQANYVIQIFPPAIKRRATEITVLLTDVSLNPNLQETALASVPLKLILHEAINPVLGGPPSPAGIPGTPEFAAANNGHPATHNGFTRDEFLDFATIGLSNQQEYNAYSQAVDPNSDPTKQPCDPPNRSKATFKQWKCVNGFNPDNDSLDDAKAVYFNGGDLEFGRNMHMKKQPNGDVAYYVSNYPTVEDARRGTNLIATVAMDYSPVTPGGPRFTKFYAYKANGTPFPDPDLDGNGGKFLPKLCVICHGVHPSPVAGSPPGDLGARFLPFDLSSFQYSSVGGFGRTDQEGEFKKLNAGILGTLESNATKDLIEAWYGGATLPSATQNSDAVPADDIPPGPKRWSGHDDLYLKVVKTSCRACHITRDPPKDFASFTNFNSLSGLAQTRVCPAPRVMPNAKVSYQKFWLERLPGPTTQVGILNQAGLTNWHSTTACPQ